MGKIWSSKYRILKNIFFIPSYNNIIISFIELIINTIIYNYLIIIINCFLLYNIIIIQNIIIIKKNNNNSNLQEKEMLLPTLKNLKRNTSICQKFVVLIGKF